MRNIWMWFYLSCKRYLRRGSFLVILLLLPAAAFLIRGAEKREGTQIRIAVAVQPSSQAGRLNERDYGNAGSADGGRLPLEQLLLEELTERQGEETAGMFRFYKCGSEDEVKAEVAARRAECGYVIPAGLRTLLEEKNYKRILRVYTAPSTVTAELASETVFAAMIRLYDRELFAAYAAETDIFNPAEQNGTSREEISARADELYEKWKENGSTFHFVYETAGKKYGAGEGQAADDAASGTELFPVRGIAAVFIFIVGIYSAAMAASDEKKGLFLALPYHIRGLCRFMSMAAPVVLAAASGMAAIGSGGVLQSGRMGRELAVMAGYIAAVSAFSWLVRLVCRRAEVICCLLPVCLIGSLVFCPVFADISQYIPELGGIGRLFLPWYYLKMCMQAAV